MTDLTAWQTLLTHREIIAKEHMRDWFENEPNRFAQFSLKRNPILLDYSRNRINKKTLSLLFKLANEMCLQEKIAALFSGHPLNITEKRPALHTALRDKTHAEIWVAGVNIAPSIQHVQEKLRHFTQQIHNKKWLGITQKPITDIVNLGIGGSYLGPMMSIHALSDFAVCDLKFHFISGIDKAHLNDVLKQINPETTLFIISSKSFSTIETLTNATTILQSLTEKFGKNVIKHHVIAITSAIQKALAFGIPEENIFPLWDWVGGRYSIWSAIGLPLILMLGDQYFDEFLVGAHEMDEHFKTASLSENMPVLLALIGIWNMNFLGATAQAIVPYAHRLRYLISYLQQADMESNGKSISLNHADTTYTTGPIIFGEEGCNGQHTYHQLLHQGKHLIPVDFILVGKTAHDLNPIHQELLIASGLSQAQALMRGKTYDEAYNELIAREHSCDEAKTLAYHQMIPGNRPSNLLFLDEITPRTLGALLALYEHKIFVQGAIWEINSFDQWGVELGKQLLPHILQHIQHSQNALNLDCATAGLIAHYKKSQGGK